MIKYFAFILLLCGGIAPSISTAQEFPADSTYIEKKQIDPEALEAYRSKKEYDYTPEKNTSGWWEHFKTWFLGVLKRFLESVFGYEVTSGFLNTFFYVLIYGSLALLLFLLIMLFAKVPTRSFLSTHPNPQTVAITEEEALMQQEDLSALINKALVQKNYRLAIRYLYLKALKQLSGKGYVKWEPQKTNDEYLKELTVKPLKNHFLEITRIYDFVWYGNFSVDEPGFLKIQQVFNNLEQKLK
ncbi:DUF4129 domain-containing protein [Ascidiimonas aurantiaca]|uniref:DUF4129 domain-containing protein n=1 Tax=Ascidiimonas aurantiaca TaxID=1685432 RepID=UPI0030EC9C7C